MANSFLLNIAEHETFSADKYEKDGYCQHFHINEQRKFQTQAELFFFHQDLFLVIIYCTTRGVRKVLQIDCILDNHGIYLYKTITKRMTDYYCTLRINILEIHIQVLFQF